MPSEDAWRNRREAGEELAAAVREQLGRPMDVLVLGLPRGGVAVAAPVAQELGGELDVLVVRKVGVPWQPELALGAVTAAGQRVRNDDVITHARLSADELESAFRRAEDEARDRERRLRPHGTGAGERQPLRLGGRTVVLVDDGIATGATARAAAALVAAQRPAPERVLMAVPVGAREAIDDLAELVDAVIVLRMPGQFAAVGAWYRDFAQVTDDEVRALLAQ